MPRISYPNKTPTIEIKRQLNVSERFATHHTKEGRVITICILVQSNGDVFAGIADRSPNDPYIRKKGNSIAQGRAWKKLNEKHGQA